jgi:hypothetical protein
MTGTKCDLFTHKSSRSYLNHLVQTSSSSSSSSSSSAALQPGVGFGLLYKVIPLLSISYQLLPETYCTMH